MLNAQDGVLLSHVLQNSRDALFFEDFNKILCLHEIYISTH